MVFRERKQRDLEIKKTNQLWYTKTIIEMMPIANCVELGLEPGSHLVMETKRNLQKVYPNLYMTFAIRRKPVDIDYIHVIDDRTNYTEAAITRAGNMATGAILAGWIGAGLAANQNHLVWDIDVDVYLKDGHCLELNLNKFIVISILHPYMVSDKRLRATRERLSGNKA